MFQKVPESVKVISRGFVLLLLLGSLDGCAGGLSRTFVLHFMPFSGAPDGPGQATLQSAIAFANGNPLSPVTIDGFHYGQYSNQDDTLNEQRVRFVESSLTRGGVDRLRIDVLGKGIAYPQGSPMPTLPPDTVRIAIGRD